MTSIQAVGGVPSCGIHQPAKAPAAVGHRRAANNLPSLTGLRWSAALMVFLYHVSVVQYFGGHAAKLVGTAFDPGNVGVSFFFVLSGFVLTWSAPNARALPFYRRRFARIYPLHIATALITLALTYLAAPDTEPGRAQLVANLTLTQSWVPRLSFYQSVNPVSWSLCCEEFFYILFPLLLLVLRRFGPRLNTFVIVACIAADFIGPTLAHHVIAERDMNFYLYYFPAARLPEFVIGMALALLVRSGRWRGPGMATSLGVFISGYFFSHAMPFDYSYYSCTIVGITCLIAAVALADIHGEPSPWRGRRAVRLGELSFAFYMVHILVMREGEVVFRAHPREGWVYGSLDAGSAFVIALTAAWILHRCAEIPLRRLLLGPRPKQSR